MPTMTPSVSKADAARTYLCEHAKRRIEIELASPVTSCKVCGGSATLFDVLDFDKRCKTSNVLPPAIGVPVYYRRCEECGFIGTNFFDSFTAAEWTELVYNEDYYRTVDPEYIDIRPQGNANAVNALLCDSIQDWWGLDYGGGNGSTAERLRRMGYRYDCYDPYGTSTVTEMSRHQFNFCSVFEVAEHSPQPKFFLNNLLEWCSKEQLAILIGTQTHDCAVADTTKLNWWYAAPRNGHVSLYSRRSLEVLAGQFGLNCLSLSDRTHLFTRGYKRSEAWRFLVKGKLRGRLWRLLASS